MRVYPAAVAARHDLIMQWLTEKGRLDVLTVAGRLGVAQETVRRDLRSLESDGRLQRVHGGAVPVEADPFPGLAPPVDHRAERSERWPPDCGRSFPGSGTILLGAGRLTLALTTAMISAPPTTAAPHGGHQFAGRGDRGGPDTEHVGLQHRRRGRRRATRAQEGDWALQELDRLHVDVSLICPAGISLGRRPRSADPAAAAISRAEVACGQKVIVLADCRASGRSAFVRFAIDQVTGDRHCIESRLPAARTGARKRLAAVPADSADVRRLVADMGRTDASLSTDPPASILSRVRS